MHQGRPDLSTREGEIAAIADPPGAWGAQIARDQIVADRIVCAKTRLDTVASLVKLQTLQVHALGRMHACR